MEPIQLLVTKAHNLIERAEQLAFKQPSIHSIPKLIRKVRGELSFLIDLEKTFAPLKENQLRSTNLTHLEAVLSAAEILPDVTHLFNTKYYTTNSGWQKAVIVDIIAKKGTVWIKVTARKGRALHRVWEGEGNYGDKDIVKQVQEYQHIAAENPINFQQPNIHVIFFNGITKEVQDELHSVGVVTHGHVCNDTKDCCGVIPIFDWSSLKELAVITQTNSMPDKVNLDVSTMIALTSELTHGGCWYTYPETLINDQAARERVSPLLVSLYKILKGKLLYACKTAVTNFEMILNTVGGPKEQIRAQRLLAKLTIVDDCISIRTQELGRSNKIKQMSKITFGTADYLQMMTLSANASFIRASSKHGVVFVVEIHQSRTFTEKKQANALPLDKIDQSDRIKVDHILMDILDPS